MPILSVYTFYLCIFPIVRQDLIRLSELDRYLPPSAGHLHPQVIQIAMSLDNPPPLPTPQPTSEEEDNDSQIAPEKGGKSSDDRGGNRGGGSTSMRGGKPDPFAGLPAEFASIIRIDVSLGVKSIITFINNLERDTIYKRWPRRLDQLLMPSWSLHTIARNLYTVVCMINPISNTGIHMLQQINALYQQQYPIRFGVIITCQNSDPKQYELCTFITRLYLTAKEIYTTSAANQFLFSISNVLSTRDNADLSMNEISTVFVSAISEELQVKSTTQISDLKTAVKDILKNNVLHIDYLKNTTVYMTGRNLIPNSYSLNGIVRTDGDLSAMVQLIGREQYLLSHWVRTGYLTDKTSSIFNTILTLSKAYPRYHTMLEEEEVTYVDMSSIGSERGSVDSVGGGTGGGRGNNGYFSYTSEGGATSAAYPLYLSLPLESEPIDIKSTFKNTTFVFVPSSSTGLLSLANSLTWLSTLAPPGRHMLYTHIILTESVVTAIGQIESLNPIKHSINRVVKSIGGTARGPDEVIYDDLEQLSTVFKMVDYLHTHGASRPGLYTQAVQVRISTSASIYIVTAVHYMLIICVPICTYIYICR